MRLQRFSAVLAACVALIVSALSAGGAGGVPLRDELIRPNVGIGRVTLGMSLAEVKRRLGPERILNKRVRRGPNSEYVEYAWDFGSLRVGFVKRRDRAYAVLVATTLRRERTPSGVGVGSTPDAVTRKIGAECFSARDGNPYREPGSGRFVVYSYCLYGSASGRRTVFLIRCTERTYQCGTGYRVYEVVVRGAF